MCICGGNSVLYSKVSPSILECKPCPICNQDMHAWKELEPILDECLRLGNE